MRIVVALGTVAAALAVAVAAPARVSGDTAKWLVDPTDTSGSTLKLQVTSSSGFKSLFLYPNGAFSISDASPAGCRAIVAPQGMGVGCSLGSVTSVTVKFKTTPSVPPATSAKLVLDNADGAGARTLTVTLETCGPSLANQASVYEKLGEAGAEYRRALHELVQVENAGLGLLFWGELGALAHDKAVDDFHAAEDRLAVVRTAAEKVDKELADCKGKSARRPLSAGRHADCTEVEWAPLLARGAKIELRKLAPLTRKIITERKRKQAAAASRDLARFHAQLKVEARAARGLMKAVDACK